MVQDHEDDERKGSSVHLWSPVSRSLLLVMAAIAVSHGTEDQPSTMLMSKEFVWLVARRLLEVVLEVAPARMEVGFAKMNPGVVQKAPTGGLISPILLAREVERGVAPTKRTTTIALEATEVVLWAPAREMNSGK
jgi:hypothetical protein